MKRILCGFWLILCVQSTMASTLIGMNYERQGSRLSVSLTVKGFLSQRLFTLTSPNRVVVDLTDTQFATNINKQRAQQIGMTGVRVGRLNAHTLRLVFELPAKVTVHTSPWHTAGYGTQGIRIDMYLADRTQPASMGTHRPKILPIYTTKKPIPTPIIKSNPQSSNVTSRSPMRDVVVVLDAGHGGKDPGAHGTYKSLEKNVTLSIAKTLKQLIDRQPGMRAVLTRSGDNYVGLRERLDIARRYKADIFVSIHADAFIHHESNGASVFALSERGATSEAAQWLAAKENHSELGGVNLSGLDDTNGLVRTVLVDLSQTATISSSLKMGRYVLQDLTHMTRLHSRKVEQAGFVVLKSPDIPSILIETGFITNPQEERNLTSVRYQSVLTQSIFRGLKNYFLEYPPHGSRLEWLSEHSRTS